MFDKMKIKKRPVFFKARKVFLTLSAGALSLLYACDSFLEIEPREAISEELAIVDANSLNTAIRGAYRALGSGGYYGEGYVNLGFIPSGDVIYNVADNLSDLNFRADVGAFANAWAAIYSTINIANTIIQEAPSVVDVNLSDVQRNTILGEAHFIRALAYFDLARAWGGVPIKLTPTTDVSQDADIQRSTREETYNLVLRELELAESLLPEGVNRIRATKYTVWALKARYYLYNEQWDEAIAYATRVINLQNDYRLLTPFSSWFLGGVVQTQESIFELAFSAQNESGFRTRMSLLSKGGEYRYRPADSVLNALRNPSTGGGRVALLDSVTQGGTTQYAGALYYRSPATDPSYVLRIAEQYLIRAEARAHHNDLEGANADLNTIRDRANLPASTLSTPEALLAAILEERRLEFLWEAHRYFDLTRTGQLKEKVEAYKPNLTIQDHHYLFPIPVDEVILGGLTQNPGY